MVNSMQIGFYFDQTRCIGCETCVVACKDWHDIPAGQGGWRRVITIEEGRYPKVFVAHLSTACHHCADPPCVSDCPTGALEKRERDGIVTVNTDLCLGKDNCGTCVDVCPYAVPQFGSDPDERMQKCDLCLDLLAKREPPICVGACPMRAIEAGPLEELRAKYGNICETEGFIYDKKIAPSIIINPKKRTL